ncbi:MAG: class I SAM-dependent methyltransferase [Pseudomonadota bacterium]
MIAFLKTSYRRLRKFLRKAKPANGAESLRARFTGVYRSAAWGSSESLSGPGSERNSGSVRQALIALSQIVEKYEVRSVADIPCGDFNWMPEFLEKHPSVAYAGYDIVGGLVSQNRKSHPAVKFYVLDITEQVPPRADLIFSKDLVNHLLDRDVWKALANMIRSGATYLMITSNSVSTPNEDLPRNVGGMSRLLNLRTEPFSFPTPIYEDGYLAVWRTEDLVFVLDHKL